MMGQGVHWSHREGQLPGVQREWAGGVVRRNLSQAGVTVAQERNSSTLRQTGES